jgi:NhaP-type Na+/H+ or K+/H+ antiporter
VAINTIISGFSFRILLNYSQEISWAASFTFASIISATDPVAVVALLKEMGTSK